MTKTCDQLQLLEIYMGNFLEQVDGSFIQGWKLKQNTNKLTTNYITEISYIQVLQKIQQINKQNFTITS
jgi:hypothetical protein